MFPTSLPLLFTSPPPYLLTSPLPPHLSPYLLPPPLPPHPSPTSSPPPLPPHSLPYLSLLPYLKLLPEASLPIHILILFLQLCNPLKDVGWKEGRGMERVFQVDHCPRCFHHGVLLVVLHQLCQTTERWTTSHVKYSILITNDNMRNTLIHPC